MNRQKEETADRHMANKPTISIIMPLYNAERFLKETLDSVLKQTYHEYELICIDDASTDKTVEILKEFQSFDNRIRIISNQVRLGAAISRNIGIQKAVGKYITFLDGDDIFEEEMLQCAYRTMDKSNVDIVMYECVHTSSNHIYEKQIVQRDTAFVNKYCKNPFAVKDCAPVEFVNWTDAPWNKLYKREFILRNQLVFQDLPSSNDVYFVQMAMFLADKLIFLNDRRVMVYARNHDTSTRISYHRDPMCSYKAWEKIGMELYSRKKFDTLLQHYYYRVYFGLRYVLAALGADEAKQYYDFLKKEGSNRLLNLCGNYKRKIDKYTYEGIERYQKESYESGWYLYETYFKFRLYHNPLSVLNILQDAISRDVQIALWGFGKNGKIFLDFLQIHNIKIAEIVDQDINKQGCQIGEYVVKSPYDVLERIQLILLASYGIHDEVSKEVKNYNIEVVDLEELVRTHVEKQT